MSSATFVDTPPEAARGTPLPAPEFLRIPKPHERDPLFGLSRASFYALERAGKIKFKRLRLPGNVKGVVLVSVADLRALIEGAPTTPTALSCNDGRIPARAAVTRRTPKGKGYGR